MADRRVVDSLLAEIEAIQAERALAEIETLQGGRTFDGYGALIEDGSRIPRADDPIKSNPKPDNRFGDTTSEVTEGPRQAFKTFLSGATRSGPSPTETILPETMNPYARRTIAQAGDIGGAALNALAVGATGAAGILGEVVGGPVGEFLGMDARTGERKFTNDVLTAGQVAIPELAGFSGAVPVGAAVRTAAGREAIPPIKAPRNPRQEAARAADDLGVVPYLGMLGRTGATTAAMIEKVPVFGNIIVDDAARAVGDVERVFYEATARLGKAEAPDQAGTILATGMDRYVQRFQKTSGKLYETVGEYLPAGAMVRMDNAIDLLEETKKPFESNPKLASKLGLDKWDDVMSEAGSNGISWKALSDFRSQLGRSIGKLSGELSDQDAGRLKLMYGALTRDMEAAATAAGGDALSAWKAATKHYKQGAKRISTFIDRGDNVAPERVFELFARMASKDRTTSDANRLRAIKKSMKNDDWRNVSASIVERMGKATDGAQNADGDQFSPARFLTNWNKLSKEAKTILFPEATRIELTKLAKVAGTIKEGAGERNHSNTGTIIGGVAAIQGVQTNPILTAITGAGIGVSAYAMTSPIFLRAMNKAMRGDLRSIRALQKGPYATDARALLNVVAANQAASPGMRETPYRQPRASGSPF